MRISDWSSDVCSSDLRAHQPRRCDDHQFLPFLRVAGAPEKAPDHRDFGKERHLLARHIAAGIVEPGYDEALAAAKLHRGRGSAPPAAGHEIALHPDAIGIIRSEEHTSEIQSLMRIS